MDERLDSAHHERMKVKLTDAEAQLVAGQLAEIVETMQDEYGPTSSASPP
jgi:hypothetical protein